MPPRWIVLLLAFSLPTALLPANDRPNLSITGERYLNFRTYLITGTVTDDQSDLRLVYRIRKVETVIRLGNRRTWRLRLPLEATNTRLVFFAMDRNGTRSPRQKRLVTRQAKPTPTPDAASATP